MTMSDSSTHTIRVWLRFYGELNDLLSAGRRQTAFSRILPEPTSVKDLIEGCGVPHTEVDLILVNGRLVDFSWPVEGGERVSVYPLFRSIEISGAAPLQARTLREPRFLVDVNLGKLARFLRMAGFDTAYRNDAKDRELIGQMLEEDRVLLTRDRKLLMHKVVQYGCLVRSTRAADQLEEVLRRYDLFGEVNPYSRCIHCNGLLKSVPKEEVLDQLEPLTKRYYNRFSQCTGCGQVYWAGTHRDRLDPKVQKILNRNFHQ